MSQRQGSVCIVNVLSRIHGGYCRIKRHVLHDHVLINVLVILIIIVINMVVTYNSNSLLLLPCARIQKQKREKGEWTRSAVLYKRVKIV